MDTSADSLSPDACIFCSIIAGRAPATVVYQDEHTLAFMDINPATSGHVLVVPRRHARDIFDVSEEDAQHVMRTVVRVARAIDRALEPDGVNLIQASRRAAFQSVYHFHMHIVPRWFGDGIAPPWRRVPGDPKALRETGARIRRELESQ